MTTDLAWFKANPSTNMRVRDPLPGEVDESDREMLPVGATWDCPSAMPEGQRAQVVAIKLPLRRVARFLGAAPCNQAGEAFVASPLVPIALGACFALA